MKPEPPVTSTRMATVLTRTQPPPEAAADARRPSASRLGCRLSPRRLLQADLRAIPQHQVVRPGLGSRPVDRDVAPDQAVLDPAPHVGDGRALEDDRVLDLAGPHGHAVADRGEGPDVRVLDEGGPPHDGRAPDVT